MKVLDRILSCLLILGGVGHTLGSFLGYKSDQMMLLWSLSASLFVFILGALNLIRAGRVRDVPLTWVCLVGGVCHIISCVRFGQLIGNFFDPRPLIFIVITLGLCAMCIRTLIAK